MRERTAEKQMQLCGGILCICRDILSAKYGSLGTAFGRHLGCDHEKNDPIIFLSPTSKRIT